MYIYVYVYGCRPTELVCIKCQLLPISRGLLKLGEEKELLAFLVAGSCAADPLNMTRERPYIDSM